MGGQGASSGFETMASMEDVYKVLGNKAHSKKTLDSYIKKMEENKAKLEAEKAVPTKSELSEMSGGKPEINATKFTQAEWQAKYDAQKPTQAQKSAAYDYTYPYAGPSGFSPSQDMNYKLDTGKSLTPKEQNMLNGMTEMATPLGHDSILHRGAHADALAQLGVSNWNNWSEAKLKQSLVGAQWDKKSLTSTSYDQKKSPFITGPQSGGREVLFRIHAAGSTKATAVNPQQAEVVLGQNTHWQITDASFTGKWAYPKAGGSYKQIVIDVDVWQ